MEIEYILERSIFNTINQVTLLKLHQFTKQAFYLCKDPTVLDREPPESPFSKYLATLSRKR